MLALVSNSSVDQVFAARHHDHEMAYFAMHPNKATASHVQREVSFEPITEEQTIEAAKLNQQSFVQVLDDEFAEGDDDSNMGEAERAMKFKEDMGALSKNAEKVKAAAKAKSL